MRSKLLLAFLLYILRSNSCFAQSKSTYSDNLTKIIAWVSDIDSVIIRNGNKEKLKSISHQLSYIAEGLGNIIAGEKDLADNTTKRGEMNNEDSVQIQLLVNQIAGDIDQLNDRLKKINRSVSLKDQTIIEPIIQSFNEIRPERDTIKLNHLKRYLYGQVNPEEKLKKEVKQSKEIAEKLLDKINGAKKKIKTKLTIN